MIVDEVIELNTLGENISSASRAISGKLKCVILSLNKKAKVEIYFSQYPEIKVLEILECDKGTKYLPLKIESTAIDGSLLREDNSYWVFNNDDLVFRVSGPNETKVNFTVRLEQDA
jgi:hypothetical protein